MYHEVVKGVKSVIWEILGGVHTAIPGKVDYFDKDKAQVDVYPVMKYRQKDGKTVDYPLITGVPIMYPQFFGKKMSVVYPLKKGDLGLIIIAEQALDYWQYDIETDTDLPFDLTNAIFIPGLYPEPPKDLKDAVKKDKIVIRAGETVIEINDKDGVTIKGDLTVKGTFTNGGGDDDDDDDDDDKPPVVNPPINNGDNTGNNNNNGTVDNNG